MGDDPMGNMLTITGAISQEAPRQRLRGEVEITVAAMLDAVLECDAIDVIEFTRRMDVQVASGRSRRQCHCARSRLAGLRVMPEQDAWRHSQFLRVVPVSTRRQVGELMQDVICLRGVVQGVAVRVAY
jgi:hypothetical protein